MIVKSSQRAGYRELAKHLASDENEEVRVVGTRHVHDESIAGALTEFEAIAKASNCQKHLFHVSASPAPDQKMSEKEWKTLWMHHEQINDLKDKPFIEVEHRKAGRSHRHRVYERVDSYTGKQLP